MGHPCNFAAWGAAGISRAKDFYEFFQREAGGKRILHEPHTIK